MHAPWRSSRVARDASASGSGWLLNRRHSVLAAPGGRHATARNRMTPAGVLSHMGVDRNLDWDGLFNARDLGGLRTPAGPTRWAAVMRSENPERLTEAGWAAAHAHGLRTVLDLRGADEYGEDAAPRPAGITTVRVPRSGESRVG